MLKRAIWILALFTLGIAPPARAGTILYFTDFVISDDRMAEALAALSGTHTVTPATSALDFAAKIATGDYDLGILFEHASTGPEFDAAFAALAAHIASGGLAIADDWSMDPTHAAAFETGFTGVVNETEFTVTDPALAVGLINPVELADPGWGVFSTGLTGAPAALFPSLSAAIVIGNDGRTIFNGFLSDTFADGAEGTRLYTNEIESVFAAEVPEPATIGLFVAGLLLAARRRCAG
jgi:hypothetical protein